MMEISRKLNLIIPIEVGDNDEKKEPDKIYVHSMPITKEVYRENFLILSKTFSAIFSEGLGIIAGPRIAYLMLEKIARGMDCWEGARGVENTLVQEIIKNSNVILPVEKKGWDDIPLAVAIDKKLVEPDEVLGELVFFTCVFAINKPRQARELMSGVNGLWDSVITSQTITEWKTSLPTSTLSANTGATVKTSSVPS